MTNVPDIPVSTLRALSPSAACALLQRILEGLSESPVAPLIAPSLLEQIAEVFGSEQATKALSREAWDDWIQFCRALPQRPDVSSYRDLLDDRYSL